MESLKGNVRYSFCRISIGLEYIVTQGGKHVFLSRISLLIWGFSLKVIWCSYSVLFIYFNSIGYRQMHKAYK